MSPERKPVAVVTPFHSADLTRDEQISLHHLKSVLGHYDRYFVGPRGIRPPSADSALVELDPRHFESVHSYSRLLLTDAFYEHFADYEHILIYQLDCLVFRDELERWCAAPYDYVVAPWLRDPERPEQGFSRVGNGGFCLRRVEACRAVLRSRRYQEHGPGLWLDLLRAPLPDVAELPTWRRPGARLRVLREARRGVDWYASHYSLNEDHFWCDRARLFEPGFRIAPVDAALRFSFEAAPRRGLELTGSLPFGCHAWARWDRAFWEPHLLP